MSDEQTSDEAHEEVLHAAGHEHVAATHASTFEVTTDDYLTPAGDCIVGIEADRTPADFDDAFVAACQDADARIETTLSVVGDGVGSAGHGVADDADVDGASSGDAPIDGPTQRIVARGDPDLRFTSERSAVWRTSDYVDDRTVAVGADRAATDLDRDLVDALAAGADLEVRIVVELPA